MLSFLNLLQDKSFHMLAITIGLFNGLYPENKVKDMEYPNTSQNDPSHRNSMHHNKPIDIRTVTVIIIRILVFHVMPCPFT